MNEEFTETVKSPIHEDFSYSSFSEGEKMRIDLALLFTWREVARVKNSVNTNLLIMDEVFDSSLDGFGVDEFLKIIRYIIKDANIFVISHKTELHDKFDNCIKFDKVKGFSKNCEMKILVTGHKGFIGSHVYEYFTDLGFEVDGYDRPDDLGDFKTDKIYDVVIHLAANAAIREAVENPDLFWENNVEKSKPIFDYCRDNNVRCLYAKFCCCL